MSRGLFDKLDSIANSLESKGLIKEAHDIDVIANTLEAAFPTEPGQVPNPQQGVQPQQQIPGQSHRPQQPPKSQVPGTPDLSKVPEESLKNIKIEIQAGEDLKDMYSHLKSASFLGDREIEAMMVEAGLKDSLVNLFKKGRNSWVSAWNSVKDTATKAAIKGLDSMDKVKKFIAEHPQLVWVVLAALFLGYLALPGSAMAEVIKPETATQLANTLPLNVESVQGATKLTGTVPVDWATDVLFKSMAGHGETKLDFIENFDNILQDVGKNIDLIVQEKMKLMNVSPDNPWVDNIYRGISKGVYDRVKEIIGILITGHS